MPANNIRYIAIGDNVDTIKPDGLQFLTFKLSFNDYYAQDISNKIKNYLVLDEYSSQIVKEIFYMYVNKGMSTIKIANELIEEK